MRLPDKVLEHLLRYFKIGDDAVSHRPDGNDVSRRAPKHLLRVLPDRLDIICHLINSDYGGFAQHDATPFGVDKRVGGTEIDGEIVGTQSGEQGEGHSDTSVLLVLGRALLVEEDLEGKTSLFQKNKDKQNLIR
jgi:hypothetical protein